jgi:hypothetical protein
VKEILQGIFDYAYKVADEQEAIDRGIDALSALVGEEMKYEVCKIHPDIYELNCDYCKEANRHNGIKAEIRTNLREKGFEV